MAAPQIEARPKLSPADEARVRERWARLLTLAARGLEAGDDCGDQLEASEKASTIAGELFDFLTSKTLDYAPSPPSVLVMTQEEPGVPATLPPLHPKQAETLAVIRSLLDKKGYAPSAREIGKAMGLTSSSTPHQHLKALADKGYIEYGDGPRRIRLLV